MPYKVPEPPIYHPANPTISSPQPQLSSILEIENSDLPERIEPSGFDNN